MKIYTLTVTTETPDDFALVSTTLYGKPEDAIEAYNKAVDKAITDAAFFEVSRQDDEIATDTPYRWWSIYDMGGGYDRITIELDAKEVM